MESKSLSLAGFVVGLLLACFGVLQDSLMAAAIGCVIAWVSGRLFRS